MISTRQSLLALTSALNHESLFMFRAVEKLC